MSSSALLKLLRPVATSPDAAGSDAQLVQRFHDSRDEQAFAAIVQRYGRLVWSVCRQMLHHDADVEDAYQATFLALIRSSHDIRGPLAPWLHRVAYRVSIKLRQRMSKQTERDRKTARSEATIPVPDTAWETMLASVHEEIAMLPEKLRVPLVLCCMEGMPTTEAAQSVGWKLGTFSARLTQAKQLLIERLTQRGLPITAAGLSLITLSQASALSSTHLQLALQLLHCQSPSPLIQSLCQGVVVMSLRKQLTTAAVILLGVAGAGSWVLASPQGPPTGGGGGSAPIVQGPGGGGPGMGAPGSGPGMPGGFNPVGGMQSQSQWEYRFVPTGPRSEQEYRNQFTQMQQQGFEFCGTVQLTVPPQGGIGGSGPAGDGASGGIGASGGGDMTSAESVVTALVFKRAHSGIAGGMPGGMMGGGSGMMMNSGAAGMGGIPGGQGVSGPGGTSGYGSGIGLGGAAGRGAGSGDGAAGGLSTGTGSTLSSPGGENPFERKAYQRLEGSWTAKSKSPAFRSIRFHSNEVVIDGKASTYFINPFKTPKEMNIVGSGTLLQCIYEVEDGVLKIAFYGRSEFDRPQRFSSTGAAPTTLPLIEMEFTRVPKGTSRP